MTDDLDQIGNTSVNEPKENLNLRDNVSAFSMTAHMLSHRMTVLSVIAVIVGAVALGTLAQRLIYLGLQHIVTFKDIAGFVGLSEPGITSFLFPTAMAGVAVMAMLYEIFMLGYRQSTLFELIDGQNASVRTDVFYLFLRISGIAMVLSFVMTFGMSGHLYLSAKQVMGIGLLADAHLALQFVALFVVLTFVNYWYHRAFHSPWLYELHKVHHSASHYGVLLPFRVHPLNELFSAVYGVAVLSLLGVDSLVVVLWVGLNGIYQCLVHSHVDWPAWVGIFLITPAMHRIHHSTEPRHFNKNLGIVTFWDRLFGTYYPPEHVPNFGVERDEQHLFNTDKFFREMIGTFTRWVRFTILRRQQRT